jgi:Ribbon-helix-helix protein, copG family
MTQCAASRQPGVILGITVAKRVSQVVAVSVPPESAEDFERMARDEGRNKSELFREMLRVYRAYRETGVFEALQRYGAGRAHALGVRDESDVERLIHEARGV